MKVVVLTTSYPSPEHPVAGNFVAAAVDGARALGVDVTVVSPKDFHHFGIAYGSGIAQNLRASAWRAALLPAFVLAYARKARAAARDADLVHAHWLPSALAARATRKPYVLQLWGTDVALARRAPILARPLVRGAEAVIVASEFLRKEAVALGARRVAIVQPGFRIPAQVGEPDDPPHVLFAGRLSPEKGIVEFLEASDGVHRVIVGDGPLRPGVPEAVGFVPPDEVGSFYARAAVVCAPSRREGFGFGPREAMAYGRPVVATRVGGLADLGPGSVLVPPRDGAALREAIVSLLADVDRRRELGREARSNAVPLAASAEHLIDAYRSALTGGQPT